MIKVIILCFIAVLFITPITVIIHEMGHAIPALLFTDEQVKVQYGKGNLSRSIKIGRLLIEFKGFNSFYDFTFGFAGWECTISRTQSAIIFLSGPLASFAMFLLAQYIFNKYHHEFTSSVIFLIRYAEFANLSQFISTILPMTYKHEPYKSLKSDGYRILECINKSISK